MSTLKACTLQGTPFACFFVPAIYRRIIFEFLNEILSNQPESFATMLLFLLVFTVGGIAFIPIPSLLVNDLRPRNSATAVLLGALCAATSGYGLGFIINIDSFPEWLRLHALTIKRTLIQGGFPMFVALRLVPTPPPFTLSSFVAGSTRARCLPFATASIIGIAPPVTLSAVLGTQALELFKSPSYIAGSLVAATLILMALYKWTINKGLSPHPYK